MKRIFNYLIAAVLLAVGLAACAAPSSTGPNSAPVRKTYAGGEHLLTVYGYNYTNHEIDSFSVDGVGGSDMDVSTPTAGGSKGTCCVAWRDGDVLPQKVKVTWNNASCFVMGKNSEGEPVKNFQLSYKTVEATLQGPIPKNPGYFEVHIYPDEHVEVAVTEDTSPPRLKLDGNRREKTKPCEGGQ